MTETLSLSPVVQVRGQSLQDADYEALVGIRVERALNVVGRATLRFDDPAFRLAEGQTFALGTDIKISAFPSTELFTGTIVGVTLEQMTSEQPQLVVVADDVAYKLNRGAKTYTYLDLSYSSVVRAILGRAGVPIGTLHSTSGTQKYLIQASNDLAYIDGLAARIGYVWWVDGGTFNFTKAGTSTGTAKVTLNEDLDEFSVRASALRPTEVTVSGWDNETLQTVKSPVSSSSSVWSNPPTFVQPYVNGTAKLGAAAVGSTQPAPIDTAEAQMAATALYDQSLSAAIVARGTADVNAAIKPATTLEVADAGPASGKYLVTEVAHVFDTTGFHTRFVAGPLRPAGLVDVLGRPEPDAGFALQGLVIGVVTDNNDPDKVGRVKVRYVSIPDSNIESTWARVVTTSGGKNRGIVFLPEVNDEVLVGFEGNDTRRPVVLGNLFSKTNALPESSKILGNNAVAYRRITSRLGHVIELADGVDPTTQHVLIKLGTGAQHSLRLGADKFDVTVAAGKPVAITAGTAKFEITAAGDISIEGNNVTIKAKAQLQLEGVQTAMKGSAQVQIQGALLTAKADELGTVEAGGILTLKGAQVMVN